METDRTGRSKKCRESGLRRPRGIRDCVVFANASRVLFANGSSRSKKGVFVNDVDFTPSEGLRRGDDAVGNPYRAQIYQFELFELILLLKLDDQFSIERFEATASQSTVSFPPPSEDPTFL